MWQPLPAGAGYEVRGRGEEGGGGVVTDPLPPPREGGRGVDPPLPPG